MNYSINNSEKILVSCKYYKKTMREDYNKLIKIGIL